MAYDPAANETILFGGYGINSHGALYGLVNSTWAYRNGSWTNLTPTIGTAPYPVDLMSLAYDAADGYLVGWGGEYSANCPAPFPSCNQTWAFQHDRWRALPTTHTPPSVGVSAPMVYDAADGYILLYDGYFGETWGFLAGNWTQLYAANSPSEPQFGHPVQGERMAYDAADQQAILYGSWGNNSTWGFSGGAWNVVNTTVAPHTLAGHGMTFDGSENYILLYGGQNESDVNANFSNVTWTFRAGNWTEAMTPGLAAGLTQFELAYDPKLNGSMALAYDGTTWLWAVHPPISEVLVNASTLATDTGLPVSFSARITGGVAPYMYAWTFGDGSTNASARPVHSFTGSGTFHVVLHVTDRNGQTRSGNSTVLVHPMAVATFLATPNPTDAGLATLFSLAPSGGDGRYGYAWVFGDGASSTTENPSHIYAGPGSFTARGWANDSLGQSAAGSLSILVRPALHVLNISAEPNPVDLARPVNFSARVVGGTTPYTYAWFFGDGGTGGNLANITHLFTTNGPFVSVVRVVDALGATSQAEVNLTVRLNASIFANVSGGLAPLPVRFQAEATGGVPGYTYAWTFGDGSSSQAALVSHEFQTAGSYRVTLQVHDVSGHRANASTVVRVQPAVIIGGLHTVPAGSLVPLLLEISLIAGVVAAVIIALALRRRGSSGSTASGGADPTSPYEPYMAAGRARDGIGESPPARPAPRRSPTDPEPSGDHLGDLF
jgi:PKD repeat protein